MSALNSHLQFPELFRDEVFRLETRRLWLRWPVVADAPAFEELALLDPLVRDKLAGQHPWLAGDGPTIIAQSRAANAKGSAVIMVLAPKQFPGEAIGLVAIDAASGGPPALACMLGVPHQGYGLMTEAVRTLIGAVFMLMPLERIEGSRGMHGIGARRVLEKSGFRATSRHTDFGEASSGYVLMREAWRARKTELHPRSAGRGSGSYDSCATCG